MVKQWIKLLSGTAVFLVSVAFIAFIPQSAHAASKNTHAAATDPYVFTMWTADCDSNHNPNSPTVKDTWQGLQVCYPDNKNDESYQEAALNNELEFQCTELVKRFLYIAYHYAPISNTGGSGIVDAYTRAHSDLHKISNTGSVHLVPNTGDVISYGTEPSLGHTVIVTSSSQNADGTWSINIIQQNAWTTAVVPVSIPTQTLTMGTDWIIQTPTGFPSITSWMTKRLPPGGWWIGPTGTWGSSNPVAINTVIHVGFQAIDNSNSGLNHVDFTESTNNGATWSHITALDPSKSVDSGQIQYFTHFTLTAPTILSADVYSNTGNFHLAPQGFRFICIQGGSCPTTTFAYWDGSTYGGSDLGAAEFSQPTSTCAAASNQVALFVDSNYGGSCAVLGIGSYAAPTAIGLPNDSISSVEVGGGAQVELCRDAGLSNTCEWISTNVPDLSTHSVGDNQVSSAQVMGGVATTGCSTPGSDQVTLFDDKNYGGLCITKELGSYPDPGSMGLPNDSVQSVQVGSDVKVELCRDSGLSNTCEWISTNVSDLSTHSIGARQASSAEVSLNGGISLCDGTNFTGTCQSFSDGMTNLSDYGWANRARSVKFSDVYNHHYHIVLYTGTNETGYLYHADSNVADLGSPYDGSIQSINIYPHTIPSAPSSPTPADRTVLANDTTSIALSWNGSDQNQVHVWNDTYNFTQGWQSSTSLQITNLTPGVYFWQAQASDDMGPSPWSPVWSFSINIAPGVSGGEVSIIAGDTVGLQVQTVDADNQSLTLAASDLPSFVTFTDNHNGIGTLAIAPQEANEGTYSITVSASDGTLTGSGTISLTVLPQLLTVHADASGCVATGVSFSLSQGSADSFVIKRNGTQVGTATGTATSYTDSISWWIGGTITYEVDAIQSGAQFAAGTVSFDYHSCGTAPFRSVSSQTNYSTQNSMPAGMAMDNQGCLWVANYYSSTGVVSALCSANSYNVTYQVATCSSPNGVAFDGTLIWVACYGASKLVAINPTTQSVVGNGIATPANPYSLSYANGKLFVNTWNSNVQAYDPTTGQLVCTVAAKTYYGQMAFSNGIGYVSDDATQTIVRFHTSDCSSTGSPISMGFAADRGITVCGGSVFAAYETGNQIGKYDLSTGTVSAFNLGNYPTGLTCDGASVWITNYSGNEVIRMAFDGTIYATYITPSGGNNAIFDGNSVWASDSEGSVTRFLESDGPPPLRSISSQTNYSTQNSMPAGMAMDNQGCLWVANYYSSTGVVSALCSTNSYNVTYQVATCSSPNGVAFDGTLIWVSCYGASKLVAINPTTQSVVGNGITTPANPYSLSYADGKLFVNTWNSNVQAYNPTTGQLACTVAAKTYYGQMAFSNGIGYVSDDATQTIVRFHTSDCSSAGSPISMGFAADRGITVCGGSVFAAYETGNQIGKYDLSTGAVSAFNLGNYPTGLTCDGASVWITNYSGNEVIRMAFDGTIYATYTTPSGGNNAIFDGNSVWVSDSGGSVTRFLES